MSSVQMMNQYIRQQCMKGRRCVQNEGPLGGHQQALPQGREIEQRLRRHIKQRLPI